MAYLGEIAALFTSFCWALSAVGFTRATYIFGPQITNRVRVILALIALMVINLVLYGSLLPLQAGAWRWGILSISGILGLAIGDACLFTAYKYIGPRLGLLILSLAPVFSVALAWIFLDEILNIVQIAGVLITLAGISYVILVRPGENGISNHSLSKGIILGVLAALTQAIGLVLSRRGMADNFPPFSGTLIRMLAAAAALWIAALFQGQATELVKAVREKPAGLRWAIFGATFGPVLGVSASLYSIQHTEVGITSTLIALPPLFMLPISHFFMHEEMNWQSVVGTFVALGGVALLFLG